MLSKIETAIEAIVERQAQSYTVDGVVYTALDIDKLFAIRDQLNSEITASTASGGNVYPFVVMKQKAGSGK